MDRDSTEAMLIASCLAKLPRTVQEAVQHRAHLIRGLIHRTGESIIEIARHAAAVREAIGSASVYHRWCQQELCWSRRTASRMVQVGRAFAHPTKSDALLRHFAIGSIYQLSQDGCPPEVFDACCERAQRGEKVTGDYVEELRRIARRKGTASAPPEPLISRSLSRLCHWVKQIASGADEAERALIAAKLTELAEHVRDTTPAVA